MPAIRISGEAMAQVAHFDRPSVEVVDHRSLGIAAVFFETCAISVVDDGGWTLAEVRMDG